MHIKAETVDSGAHHWNITILRSFSEIRQVYNRKIEKKELYSILGRTPL